MRNECEILQKQNKKNEGELTTRPVEKERKERKESESEFGIRGAASLANIMGICVDV